MVFITAGMGGVPEPVRLRSLPRQPKIWISPWYCHHSVPFLKGNGRLTALDAEKMSQHVDALLVINNERLRDIYSDFSVMNAFGKSG